MHSKPGGLLQPPPHAGQGNLPPMSDRVNHNARPSVPESVVELETLCYSGLERKSSLNLKQWIIKDIAAIQKYAKVEKVFKGMPGACTTYCLKAKIHKN